MIPLYTGHDCCIHGCIVSGIQWDRQNGKVRIHLDAPGNSTVNDWKHLLPKKSKRQGRGGGAKQPAAEKQSVKDARFYAATRHFVYTMVGWTKALPVKSKALVMNIFL
jgi:hypothetical protein